VSYSKSDIETWAKALRSGEYQQVQNMLQTENGHCCLGVACELFIPKPNQLRDKFGLLSGAVPGWQYLVPNWLRTIDIDFHEMTGTKLVSLNDSMNFTFDEIADCLEAVYILEVLND
jgi:hypothetical protein